MCDIAREFDESKSGSIIQLRHKTANMETEWNYLVGAEICFWRTWWQPTIGMTEVHDKKDIPNSESFSTAPLPNDCSPLQMTEAAIELLRQERVPTADVQQLLGQLAESLNHRFRSHCNRAVFEDAVLQAPWLTADAERVKQQQSDLLRILKSCCVLSRNLGGSLDSSGQLLEHLSEFAERYIETETAQEELFHSAFPSPKWTMRD